MKPCEDYLITFYTGSLGAHRVRYIGRLTWWQRLCVRMAGWKVGPR